MINTGVDFGSTYTLVSVYREDKRVLDDDLFEYSLGKVNIIELTRFSELFKITIFTGDDLQ